MTDEPITINVPAVQQQVPPPKVYASVEDPLAVYDTARFEHMARIANVMATGRMIPMSIWNDRVGRDWIELPEKVISSRCFMIVNFSHMNRIDPFQAAMSASFVHGRLCWEGKFIDGLLQERHGIVLDTIWFDGDGDFDAYEDPDRARKAGEKLGIKLHGDIGGRPRFMSGVVAQWKTSHNGSPWTNPAEFPKMLKYRGTREWCRLYKPGPITGILTNDEVQDFVDWRQEHDTRPQAIDRGAALRERLTHHRVESVQGFDAGHVARETGPGEADDLTQTAAIEPTTQDAPVEPVDDDFPGDRPTATSEAVEAYPEPPAPDEPPPSVEPELALGELPLEPGGKPELPPEERLYELVYSADKGGELKMGRRHLTLSAYLTHAEQWIKNYEGPGERLVKVLWEGETAVRESYGVHRDTFEPLRALIRERRSKMNNIRAGRG